MNMSLRPELQQFVQSKVESGEYPTADAVFNSLLSQAREREEFQSSDVDELRAALDAGIAEVDRGDFADFSADGIIADRRATRKKVS